MTEEVKRGSYTPLWILIAVCAFPYIAGTVYFQFRDKLPETGTTNYGTLVQPVREIGPVRLALLDGSEMDISGLGKKWLMLYLVDSACTEPCQKDLYYMRQVRKALAADRFRVNRLLLLDHAALETDALRKMLEAFPGMYAASLEPDSKKHLYSILKIDTDDIFGKILLIDPLGNFMLEYPRGPDPTKMLKDIKKLLDVSRIG